MIHRPRLNGVCQVGSKATREQVVQPGDLKASSTRSKSCDQQKPAPPVMSTCFPAFRVAR